MENNIKIALISLGCAKNLIDSEHMLALISQSGIAAVDTPEEADVVIINTCGFIEAAKEEAIENILSMIELKKSGVIKGIVVTGCLAERYKEQITMEMPEVDCILGTGSYEQIVSAVRKAANGQSFFKFEDFNTCALGGERIPSTPFYTAFIKIAEGCNNHCGFCVIPSLRGKYRSRPFDDIVKEAEGLVRGGVRELIVIAQDTSKYGIDLYNKVMLPELLERLCQIPEIHWVRVHYLYPDKVDDKLLDVFERNEKLVNYFDIPIQHVNSRLLKSMNRRGDKEYITELFAKIRKRLPGAVLRTSLIVGLPGETDEEFEELCDYLRSVRLTRAGVFAFSAEEGTKASEMDCQIDEDIKLKRKEIIEELQLRIMDEANQALTGSALEVLVEGFDSDACMYFGRSYADSPDIDGKILFSAEREINPGDFVNVLITQSDGIDLIGSETN